MPRRKWISEFLLFAIAMVLGLSLLEAGLRLFTVFPVTTESNKKEHPRLGYTLSPELNEVDKRGFRNTARRLEESDLVIIGDSHAYGDNVTIEHNFPSIMATKTGRNVYNFGVGSYGIYHYKILIEEAARVPVQDIILAFYPANDLSFSCRVTRTDYWKTYAKENGLEIPDCKDTNIHLSRDASIWSRLARIPGQTATVQIVTNALQEGGLTQRGGSDSISNATHFIFNDGQSVNKDRVRLHSIQTSPDNPEVRTNLKHSKAFLLDAREMLADASIGFVVLVIPSKELVLHDWGQRQGRVRSEQFETLVQNEKNLIEEYRKFLTDNDIAFFDALPHLVKALSEALENGDTFYKTGDGHPLETGYEAYAEAAIKALKLTAN